MGKMTVEWRYVLKGLMLPPGPIVIGLLISWGLWVVAPRAARRLLGACTLLLILLSTPVFSGWLMASLTRSYGAVSEADLTRAQAIVILGGGRQRQLQEYGGDSVNLWSLERLRYGAALHRRTGLPILVTGGSVLDQQQEPEAELMRSVLEKDFGVPVTWMESASRTTAENASHTAAVLASENIQRVLLVTQVWHMQRAKGVFDAAGLSAVPAPVAVQGELDFEFTALVPSAKALLVSYYALHEWLGYWVYRWQGKL